MLEHVDPRQPLGTRLFNAVMRVSVAPAFEAVCLRQQNGRTEVLLTQRSLDDTAYPGEWHCPGTFYRPNELDDDCVARLGKKEGVVITRYAFVTNWNNPHEARGHCMHLIHLCTVEGASEGRWFSINALPEQMVTFHRDVMLPAAVEFFQRVV